MLNITVMKHEWSEENFVILHFRVLTVRPTDDRNVVGGTFMVFVPKGDEVNYAVGSEFVLTKKNDIINPESEDVSDNSESGRGSNTDSGSV